MKNNLIHFIGIKGTGMAALARIVFDLGYRVQGSDIEKHFFTEDPLRDLGIPIYPFSKDNIVDNMTVIQGNAFKNDHVEVKEALSNKSVTVYTYHEFIGKLMHNYRGITVSGSHGKTTTTTMLEDMMSYSKKTSYLIGDGRGKMSRDSEYFLLEACEFRRHFLAYYPEVAIMTNFEIDHVDYFKDVSDYLSAFEEFSKNVNELLIVWGDDPHLKDMDLKGNIWTYGFSSNNKIQAKNIRRHRSGSEFDLYFDGDFIYSFKIPMVGDHMILNSLAVIGVGIYENIIVEDIEKGLQSFSGAKRRFVIEEGKNNVYVDDYAHHPTEIDVTLKAVKQRYPDRKIVAIFKPHRSGRLFYFVNEFAESLKQADVVYLSPFSSIDDFDDGIEVDVDYLQDRLNNAFIIEETEESISDLASHSPAVFVFMSSKDIYGLKEMLKNVFND